MGDADADEPEIEFKGAQDFKVHEYVEYSNVDIGDPMILERESNRRRRSPLMVEFADPVISTVDLQRAMEAGVNIVKLRMAYSTKSEKMNILSKIDKACDGAGMKQGHVGRSIATCATLKTWMIKTGILADGLGSLTLRKDSEIVLTNALSKVDKCTDKLIFIDYMKLATDVKVGMEISIINDGIKLRCTKRIDETSILCVVVKEGVLKNLETVCIRNLVHTTPFISETDVPLLKFCCQFQIDMLLIYYVHDSESLKKIKRMLSKSKHIPLIFSAICDQTGLDNLEYILKESDGIVFEREHLQYELDYMSYHRLIQIQKWVGGMCQKAGKPLFLSGGVFQNILSTGEINDSEVTDVTNALMNGVTGFIFRECVDIQNTLFAINGLNEICCSVEPLSFNKIDFLRVLEEPKIPVNAADAAIMSSVLAVNQTQSRVIIIPTVTGRTARGLLWLRPSCIVITVSSQPNTARLLSTCRNIVPLIYRGPADKKYYRTIDSRVKYAARYAVSRSWLAYGDMYVSLQRSCEGNPYCDMVRIWIVTFSKKLLVECIYSDDEEEPPDLLASKSVATVKEKKKKIKKEIKVEPNNDDEVEPIDNTNTTEHEEDIEQGNVKKEDSIKNENEEPAN